MFEMLFGTVLHCYKGTGAKPGVVSTECHKPSAKQAATLCNNAQACAMCNKRSMSGVTLLINPRSLSLLSAGAHVLVSPVCDLRLVTPVSSRSRLIHGVNIHSFIHSQCYLQQNKVCQKLE